MKTYLEFAHNHFQEAATDAGIADQFPQSTEELSELVQLPLSGSYHNLAHVLRVASLAYWLGVASGLNQNVCNMLLKAGLYHDAGHQRTLGVNDKENVERSLNIFRRSPHSTDFGASMVELIIKATTEGPHKNDYLRDASLPEQVLADSDLMVLIDKEYIQDISNGLEEEGYGKQDPHAFLKTRTFFTAEAVSVLTAHGYQVSLAS